LVLGCTSNSSLLSNAGYPIDSTTNKVTSWKELEEQNIIMQAYEYSCGAASLATLMTYYFNENISEKNILNKITKMFSREDYKKIKNEGLSLLELEKISASLGYQYASVRLKPKALFQLSGPVIVFLKSDEFKHFLVLRGVVGNRVFLSDPSRGNIRMSIPEFLDEWYGETFILGKQDYGTPMNHDLAIPNSVSNRIELNILRYSLKNKPASMLPRLQ
jgi:predicted double-glycine peptidase